MYQSFFSVPPVSYTHLDVYKRQAMAPLLEGKTIIKEIYVPGKLVNIVAKG